MRSVPVGVGVRVGVGVKVGVGVRVGVLVGRGVPVDVGVTVAVGVAVGTVGTRVGVGSSGRGVLVGEGVKRVIGVPFGSGAAHALNSKRQLIKRWQSGRKFPIIILYHIHKHSIMPKKSWAVANYASHTY
jgi:hypothetical protein